MSSLIKKEVIEMDDMSKFLNIKNKKELLRIYEMNEGNAKDAKEKSKWTSLAEDVKNKISQLES